MDFRASSLPYRFDGLEGPWKSAVYENGTDEHRSKCLNWTKKTTALYLSTFAIRTNTAGP
jgi:hypothetical protein